MKESLHLYGHNQPSVFYTDNMADKDFLEKCFPSLWEDIVPVEKYSSLELLTIPSDVHVAVLRSVDEINAAMQSILQLFLDSDTERVVVIALDSEWNVEVSECGMLLGGAKQLYCKLHLEGRSILYRQVTPFTIIPFGNHTSDWSNTGWKATASHSCASHMQSKNLEGWAVCNC